MFGIAPNAFNLMSSILKMNPVVRIYQETFARKLSPARFEGAGNKGL